MNLCFGLGTSGGPPQGYVYMDVLRVDIATPETILSVIDEGTVAIDVADAEIIGEAVGCDEIVFDFSGDGIEVAVED